MRWLANVPFLRRLWVKGGCGRQADGTAGLPSAPEIARVLRHLRFVPLPDSCIATNCGVFDQFVGHKPRRAHRAVPLSECPQLAASSMIARRER
jgi:hypothetical protein